MAEHRCGTDLEACDLPATWAYRWPGESSDRHLCDEHLVATLRACDPRQLDVRRLARDGATIEAYLIPGDDQESWRIVMPAPRAPGPPPHAPAHGHDSPGTVVGRGLVADAIARGHGDG